VTLQVSQDTLQLHTPQGTIAKGSSKLQVFTHCTYAAGSMNSTTKLWLCSTDKRVSTVYILQVQPANSMVLGARAIVAAATVPNPCAVVIFVNGL
jgi:hypothetical protein